MRGRKKIHPPFEPEGKILVSPTPTNDSGFQAPTVSRGTKWDSSYDHLSLVFNLGEENESHIDELILNASMRKVLGGSSDDYTSYYKDLKSFMIKGFFLLLLIPTFLMFIFIVYKVRTRLFTSLYVALKSNKIIERKSCVFTRHLGYNIKPIPF